MAILKSAALAILAIGLAGSAFADCDAAHGEKVFAKCKSCHQIGEKARNLIGPALTGIVGNEAASVEGYKYSKAFQQKKEEGLTWTDDALGEYLESPKDMVPGTKMTFPGLADEHDRADVICYLETFE